MVIGVFDISIKLSDIFKLIYPIQTLGSLSLQDRIRKHLEEEIRSGVLFPGAPIDEKKLALSFAASRTPVREALLLLSVQGLVEIVPRTGIYVKKLRASELIAMMEALGEFEGALARLAARRIVTARKQTLQTALDDTARCAEANDAAGYEEANAALHEVIYLASGNPFIAEQARNVRLRISAYRQKLFEKPGRLATSRHEHQLVVSAILTGNADAAAEAMREHISAGGQVFADLILSNDLR